jgi:hypothetical protein
LNSAGRSVVAEQIPAEDTASEPKDPPEEKSVADIPAA